ncbi:MAG: hypothetical protein ABIJ56_01915 [Pseudomonadota bacterium]
MKIGSIAALIPALLLPVFLSAAGCGGSGDEMDAFEDDSGAVDGPDAEAHDGEQDADEGANEAPADAPEDRDAGDAPPDAPDAADLPGDGIAGDADDADADDGPDIGPLPRCGDGNVDEGEECDDGNLTSTDACTPLCRHAECGDGFVWEGHEDCDDGNGEPGDGCDPGCAFSCEHVDTEPPYNDPDCEDFDLCTIEEICDPYTHVCFTTPASDGIVCDEGNDCTGVGSCVGGACAYADAIDCSDPWPCTLDSCDPETEHCVNEYLPEGTPCDDGFFCTGDDRCTSMGRCWGLSPEPVCGDANPCTEDFCDEDGDACVYTPVVEFRPIDCLLGETGGLEYGAVSDADSYVCGGTAYTETGPEAILSVEITAAGTFSASLDAAAGRMYLMSDICNPSSCLVRSTSAISRTLSPGTYYIAVEVAPGTAWTLSYACP